MTGKAYLVGAGPGRADLITVRGLALLRTADVVIYDRLVALELLQETRPQAERIFVGKQGHRPRTMPQTDINALLVDRVRNGLQVVRLKGGDSFVFGRGGEECLALASEGLAFEIVPGVSSAVAAPAYAGIPVTHRGLASAFTVVAGYEDPAKDESNVDWALLAGTPTLVVLMAVRTAAKICEALIEHGRDPHSPAAAIASARHHPSKGCPAQPWLAWLKLWRWLRFMRRPCSFSAMWSISQNQLAWFIPEDGGSGFLSLDPA